jgi:outer membrane protein, heavy metal efflux system
MRFFQMTFVAVGLLSAVATLSVGQQTPTQVPSQVPRETISGDKTTGVVLSQPLPTVTNERVVGGGNPLTLAELVSSLERHYPPLLVAFQDRVLADADVLTQEGQFDFRLRSTAQLDRLGAFTNERFGVQFEQPLQWNGATIGSGYRITDGTFRSTDLSSSATAAAGEVFSSARLPLFRDREIDPRRANLQRAKIGRRLADLGIEQQKLILVQLATQRFGNWLFAGQQYQIATRLLRIAEVRDKIFRDAFAIGQLPKVEVIDNERVIAQRRGAVVAARRALQQAAIDLSLFYRDDQGMPIIVGDDRVPDSFPAQKDLTQRRATEDIEAALQYRPELRRIEGQIGQNDIDVKLFKNQLKPNIDLVSSLGSQIGTRRINPTQAISRGPQEFVGGVEFVLPFQRRQAKGQLQAAEARREQFQQRLRFQKDQIVAEVRDALSAVENARDRVDAAKDELDRTRQVEEAEGLKYRLGDSTLFVLNLRERDTADAALRVAAAEADYLRSYAYYEFTVAQALR